MIIEKKVEMPRLHNFFEVEVVDSKTGEVTKRARAENVVLNQVLHYMMQNKQLKRPYSLQYGTGTGVPSASDTSLFAYKGIKDIQSPNVVVTPDLVTFTGYIKLGEAEEIGTTITEVGLYVNSVGQWNDIHMEWTHAMLEDSEGNPISIGPKTNTEIVYIYFTMYMQRGVGMKAFPNSFSDFMVATGANGPSGRFSAMLIPQDVGATGSPVYTESSKTLQATAVRIATTAGNAPTNRYDMPLCDIRALQISPLEELIIFPNTDVFPTYSFTERTIGVGDGSNKAFNLHSGFFVPESAVVKVDGVAQIEDVDFVMYQGARSVINFTDLGDPYGSKIEVALALSNANKEIVTELGVLNPRSSDAVRKAMFFGGSSWMPAHVIADFGKVTKVGAVQFVKYSNSYAYNQDVYYSADGVNWSLLGNVNAPYSSTSYGVLENLHDLDIRYLWFPGTYLANLYVFGPPSIVFNVAPALDKVVTASWDTAVPPKNANIYYDIDWAVIGSW